MILTQILSPLKSDASSVFPPVTLTLHFLLPKRKHCLLATAVPFSSPVRYSRYVRMYECIPTRGTAVGELAEAAFSLCSGPPRRLAVLRSTPHARCSQHKDGAVRPVTGEGHTAPDYRTAPLLLWDPVGSCAA